MAAFGKMLCSFASNLLSRPINTPLQQFNKIYNHGNQTLVEMLSSPWQQQTQVRCRYPNRWTWRDLKRRRLIGEHYNERTRLRAVIKNKTLPVEIRELGKMELAQMPVDSSIIRKNNRCAVTGRARGKVKRYRVSRFVFRELADYNQLAGVTRAWW